MDLGTWQTFSEIIEDNYIGNVKQADCQNIHVINALKIPVLSVGLENLIVAATPDGILISDKDKAQFIKTHIEEMNQRPMYEEHKWGVFRVLDHQEIVKVKNLLPEN